MTSVLAKKLFPERLRGESNPPCNELWLDEDGDIFDLDITLCRGDFEQIVLYG